MGREFELKYRADAGKIQAIRTKFVGFSPISMETTYFDTPDGTLRRLRWTLRRRLENGVSVCTVKTPAAGGARGEWETENAHILDAVPELCKLGAPAELLALTAGGVTETCAARFTRLAATVAAEGCTVEIALDQGSLLGGRKAIPFAEVEVELKAGSEDAAVAFAEALAKDFGLTPEPKSKLARALELTQNP